MTDNSVIDADTVINAIRTRFCKNSVLPPQEQKPIVTKKSMLDLKHAIEQYCDEEDRKARELWLKAIETENSIFYNLTEYSALSFLEKINRNLERKYDEGMLLVHIDPEAVLAKYEKLVNILRRDDLLDILEKCATLDA